MLYLRGMPFISPTYTMPLTTFAALATLPPSIYCLDIGMTERAKERSAFCTRRGLFQFTRMPFGLAGAPASFCRLMSIVFKDHLWKICLSYLDDIIVYARTPEELLDRLRTDRKSVV